MEESCSNQEDIPLDPPSKPKPATTTGTQTLSIPEPVSPPLGGVSVQHFSIQVNASLPDDNGMCTSIEETSPSQDNSERVYVSNAVFFPTGSTDKLVSPFQDQLPNVWETECSSIEEPSQDNSKYYVCGSFTLYKATTSEEEAVYSQFMADCDMRSSESSFLSLLSDIEPADDLAESENSGPGVTDLNENSYTCVEQTTTDSFDQEVTSEQEIISEGQSDSDNEDQNSSLGSQPDSGFSPSLGSSLGRSFSRGRSFSLDRSSLSRSFSLDRSSLNRSFSLERSSSLEQFSSLDQSSLDHSSLDPTSDDQPADKMTCGNAQDSSPPSKKKRRGKKKA